ncbi:unnamed protein product [Orchesella dallaii]|uniref:Urea transporter 1 n=1 Tax=Orchesella dallaii TaxID=48710 RepID=A0ABP1QN64_9HEXA
MAQSRNRRLHNGGVDKLDEDPPSWYFCFGNSAAVDTFLETKHGKVWLVPKFLNALFRGIGQVINLNPLLVTSGLVSFNSILLASVTSSIWTPLYGHPVDWKVVVFIMVGSSLSVFISAGLSNISNSFKPSVPILSIPFHILTLVIITCLRIQVEEEEVYGEESGMDGISIAMNETIILPNAEDWSINFKNSSANPEFYSQETLQNYFMAVILSGGQVFGVIDMFSSLLIYTGLLIFSPILTFMCLLGAVFGTLLGLFLTPFPNATVFLGLWGFNGLLSFGAIGLFYVFTIQSIIHGIASTCFTAFLQFCLSHYFAQINLPVLAFPFLISTVLFICVLSEDRHKLRRVSVITFPELHRKCLKRQMDEEVGVQQELIHG